MTRAPRPTPIAFVITELNVGGAERCLVNLVTGLDKEKYAARVYSLGPRPCDEQHGLVTQLEAAEIPVRFGRARSIRHLTQALSTLRRAFAEQPPCIIQTFLFHANVLGSWSADLSQAKLIAGIRVADPRRWRMFVERLALRKAERIVCVSHSVAKFARNQVRLPATKLVVIPNGIAYHDDPTTQTARLSNLGIHDTEPVILFVGRLEEQKGIGWLLRAAPAIQTRLPDHHLVLVGDGPLRSRLEAQAAASPAAAKIHFLGWRSDIASLLKRSQLLVLPSRWEGMPNVVLEAMSAGLPVVATRVDGVEELLGDCPQQIVEYGNDLAFANAIQAIADDPELAAALGQRNVQRAINHFSLAAMVRRYELLYESVLGSQIGGNS